MRKNLEHARFLYDMYLHRPLTSGLRVESRCTHSLFSVASPGFPRAATDGIVRLLLESFISRPSRRKICLEDQVTERLLLFCLFFKFRLVNASYRKPCGKEGINLASSHLETVNVGNGSLRVELPLNNWMPSRPQG